MSAQSIAAASSAPPRRSARGALPPFLAMSVSVAAAERRAAGKAVFDLGIGQPSTPAPRPALDAAAAALRDSVLAYTPPLGMPILRERIAAYYKERYGLDVPPSQVALTTGSSGGFALAYLTAFDAGDVVALPRPSYSPYRNLLRALDCRVLEIPAGAEQGFKLTVAALEALPQRPAGLIIASPGNPSGTMMSPDELRDVAAWCDDNGVTLISDEIYHGVTYGDVPEACARSFSDRAWVVNSFSKYFSMTGWRLGWMLVPEGAGASLDRLATAVALCPPTLSQHAALAAFDAPDELAANVERYRANRAILRERLPQLGFGPVGPMDGAFYAYADISRWSRDSVAFCARAMSETGVAMTAGAGFDSVQGGSYVRICYAGSEANLSGALDALAEWLPTLPPAG
ncbi:MAG: aminotransferase class I/II-fold pyridoxal phosphate-dependent enzyme [Frankiaceae bacterium]|nr:aminotransferase class I/II-fold pyridoxal phosphate-dependent enzyme [Frankiaceae bacterium]